MVNCLAPEAREQIPAHIAVQCDTTAQHVEHRVGSVILRVVVGLGAVIFYLYVHPHLTARIQRFVERRHIRGKLVFGEMGDDPTVCKFGVMVHDQFTAAALPDVELHRVRTHLPRTSERSHGVGALSF
jgi:hypothetical protein